MTLSHSGPCEACLPQWALLDRCWPLGTNKACGGYSGHCEACYSHTTDLEPQWAMLGMFATVGIIRQMLAIGYK